MAAKAKDNPFEPALEKVISVRTRLLEFISKVLAPFKPIFKMLKSFVKQVRSSAKMLIDKIGKGALNSFLSLSDKLMAIFPGLERLTMEGLKIAQKIIALIKKTADPNKIMKAVKGMVARLAKLFRQVVALVRQILGYINPIHAVLRIIDTFKMVLRVVLSWIVQVSPLVTGVKRLEAALKKVAKTLQAELKTVTHLVKEVNALKPV